MIAIAMAFRARGCAVNSWRIAMGSPSASNQQTSIGSWTQGTCIGRAATGTGLYYTAREGADGTDRFSVSATLAGGKTITRMFEVTITQ